MDLGACANCDATGVVGEPCATPHCARRGLHFIPREDAEAQRALPVTQLEGLVGTMVGEFLILRRLGRGGFGRVLLGLQRPLFRLRAAVKVLELDAHSPRMRTLMLEKFENEARTLAVLRHPNVVGLLQYGRIGEEPFLAMEYIPGGRTIASEVDARAERGTVLELSVTRRLLDQVLRGLEAAHREGIIHRDLKPNNVMLETIDGDPWHVKIVDFGLAKDFAASDESSVMIGTPAYMAPEQAMRKQMGPWTDLYAVGVMAVEMLTGRSLFRGTSEEILHQKLAAPALFPDVAWSDALRQALVATLAPKPEERLQTAQALRQALITSLEPGAIELMADPIEPGDPLAATALPQREGPPALEARAPAATRAATPSAMSATAPRAAASSMRRWLAGGGTLLVAAGLMAFVVVGSSGDDGTPNASGAAATDGTAAELPPADPSHRIQARAASAASFLPPWKGFTFAPPNAIDGVLTTSWQPDARGTFGLGQALRVELPGFVAVERVEIDAGFQATDGGIDFFCANAAPTAVSVYPDGGVPWRAKASADGRRIVLVPPDDVSRIARGLTIVPDAVRAGSKWAGDMAISEVRVFGAAVQSEAVAREERGPIRCADRRIQPLRMALVRGCADDRDSRPSAACTLWRALFDRCAAGGVWDLGDAPALAIAEEAWSAGKVTVRAKLNGAALEATFARGRKKADPAEWSLGSATCKGPSGSACGLARDVLALPQGSDPELAPASACKSL